MEYVSGAAEPLRYVPHQNLALWGTLCSAPDHFCPLITYDSSLNLTMNYKVSKMSACFTCDADGSDKLWFLYCLYCTNLVSWFSGKLLKLFPCTRCQILWLKCTKIDFGWGSAPEHAGGAAYSAPPDSLAWFKGPTFKGFEGKENERSVRRGEQRRKREVRRGEGRKWRKGDGTKGKIIRQHVSFKIDVQWRALSCVVSAIISCTCRHSPR